MEQLLAFGGLIFWGVVLLVSLLIVYSIETNDRQEIEWPLIWFFIAVGALGWFYRFDFKEIFVNLNWINFILGFLCYLTIGIVWMIFKWNQLCKKKYAEYLEQKAKYDAKERAFFTEKESFMPKVNKEKSSLTMWLFFFPFSMLRYALTKFFIDLRDKILQVFESFLNGITNRTFKA